MQFQITILCEVALTALYHQIFPYVNVQHTPPLEKLFSAPCHNVIQPVAKT